MKHDVSLSFAKNQKLAADVTVTMPPTPEGIRKVEMDIPKGIRVDMEAPTVTIVHKFPDPLIVQVREEPKNHLEGGIMFIVKATQPDVAYQIAGLVVVDAEGHVIPDAKVTPKVVSDNLDAVSLTPDVEDPGKGIAHFESPGGANINVFGVLANGTELAAPIGAQFMVTAGDPAAISGGTIAFEGLEEAPVPPTP